MKQPDTLNRVFRRWVVENSIYNTSVRGDEDIMKLQNTLNEADLPAGGRVAERQIRNIKTELAKLHKYISLDKPQTDLYHKARRAIDDLAKSL